MFEPEASSLTDRSLCTVVVPCYNEASRLKPQVFLDYVATCEDVHLIFVNDGSRDGTLAMLTGMAAKAPGRISVLDRQPNAGKAESVRAGMLAAQPESAFIGFWDADLATPLEAIAQLRREFARNPPPEMVFGSRVQMMGRQVDRSPIRHYVGRVFATVVSTMLQIPIYDSQCGAKLFRATPALAQVLATPFQSRWIFDVEIIARFLALHRQDQGYAGRALYERPLDCWTEVPGSKVSPLDFVKSLWEVLTIRMRYLR